MFIQAGWSFLILCVVTVTTILKQDTRILSTKNVQGAVNTQRGIQVMGARQFNPFLFQIGSKLFEIGGAYLLEETKNLGSNDPI